MNQQEFEACCNRLNEQYQNLMLLAKDRGQCMRLQDLAIGFASAAIALEASMALGDAAMELRFAAQISSSNLGAGI